MLSNVISEKFSAEAWKTSLDCEFNSFVEMRCVLRGGSCTSDITYLLQRGHLQNTSLTSMLAVAICRHCGCGVASRMYLSQKKDWRSRRDKKTTRVSMIVDGDGNDGDCRWQSHKHQQHQHQHSKEGNKIWAECRFGVGR